MSRQLMMDLAQWAAIAVLMFELRGKHKLIHALKDTVMWMRARIQER